MLIHKELTARLQDIIIPTQLEWSDTDPLAVKVNFHSGGAWVRWQFSLDLMTAGLGTVGLSAGLGDVKVETILDALVLTLNSPEGVATVSMDWDLVSHFVGRIVTEFSAEDEAKAVAQQVESCILEFSRESF